MADETLALLGQPSEKVLQELETWLSREGATGALVLDGPPSSGKTQILREFSARHADHSVLVDAEGRGAEEVFDAFLREAGIPVGPRRGIFDLTCDLRDRRTERVLVIANAQWSGSVTGSREPERMWQSLVSHFIELHDHTGLRILVEADSSLVPSFTGRPPLALLDESSSTSALVASLAELAGLPRAVLEVLALAQRRRLDREVWEALCGWVGTDIDAVRLRELSFSGDVAEHVSVDGSSVRFRHASTARLLRAQIDEPTAVAFHRRVAQRLADLDEGGAIAEYRAAALPAHSAAAGLLSELLDDLTLLFQCDPRAVLEALPVAFPDGIPAGTVAADLHHLQRAEVILPSTSSSECASWLHHLAVCRGDFDAAQAIAAAAGPLPWHTVWANCRAFGDPNPPPTYTSGLLGVRYEARDGNEGGDGGGYLVTENDLFEIQKWHPETGKLVTDASGFSGPAVCGAAFGPAKWKVEPAAGELRLTLAADPQVTCSLPAHYEECGETVVPVGDLVIVGTERGLYAMEVDAQWAARHSTPPYLPKLAPLGDILPRPYDADECRVSRERLAEVFGADRVHVIPDRDLPSGLTHGPTRDFLSRTGFPHVEDLLSTATLDLTASGLREQAWDEVRRGCVPLGDGPLYRIGEWMGGALLLDGSTGQVLRRPTNRSMDSGISPADVLAGSGLETFTMMVTLQWRRMRAYDHASSADAEDLLRELGAWFAGIDPEAAATINWQHQLAPEGFDYL
ncbi:SUKH-4 family immunity protein [Streptomyces sp. NPDC057694]|uniref:SUKH-4 family immunity protein n=1 Tax=Streptomyces sp. NPDC057694 TaxID=3346216 RepID=UPI0036BD81AD